MITPPVSLQDLSQSLYIKAKTESAESDGVNSGSTACLVCLTGIGYATLSPSESRHSAIYLITPDGECIQVSPVREICTLGLMRRGLETSLRSG
jgi:hypothetical protein